MGRGYKLEEKGSKVQKLLKKISGLKALGTQPQGADPTPLEGLELEGVAYSVITKSVNDLVNYYTKSQVYTKEEVQQRLSSLVGGFYVPVPELPEPSADTFGLKIYLVPSPDPKTGNLKDEYITVRSGSEGAYTYDWEQIGSTAVDLSGYVTTSALEALVSSLHDVKHDEQSLTVSQKAIARQNIGAGTYTKPNAGIPLADLAPDVVPDVSQFITKTVNDLVNYYTKSEVFTKEEVQQRLSSLVGGFYVPVPELPEPSADTFGLKIYLVPSPDPKTGNLKDEYITVRSGSEGAYTYDWEQIGSTAIDLSGYVTTSALETALAGKVSPSDLEEFTVQELEALWDAAQGE